MVQGIRLKPGPVALDGQISHLHKSLMWAVHRHKPTSAIELSHPIGDAEVGARTDISGKTIAAKEKMRVSVATEATKATRAVTETRVRTETRAGGGRAGRGSTANKERSRGDEWECSLLGWSDGGGAGLVERERRRAHARRRELQTSCDYLNLQLETKSNASETCN